MLLEQVQNKHMDHIEDLPFLYGQSGLRDAILFTIGLRNMLKGKQKLRHFATVKWDGQPQIICGRNPENGKFFVATKSLFNKEPKINYTQADVDRNHGGDLAEKLKLALALLRRLPFKEILQGDLMFDQQIKKVEDIDGEKYVTFQPNTIKYAVPVDSDIAKDILSQKLGIVFHTTYKGNSIDSLSASFGADVSPIKGKSKQIWISDASITDVSGTQTLTQQETDIVTQFLSRIGKMFRTLPSSWIDSFQKGGSEELLGSLIMIYTNQTVNRGDGIQDQKKHLSGLVKWIEDRYQKEIDKVKTEASKEKKKQERDALLKKVSSDYKSEFITLFTIQELLTKQKLILLRKLERIEGMTKQFLKTPDGYKVTKPEGFVVVSHEKGNAVKIVDRLEFSRSNAITPKEWKK